MKTPSTERLQAGSDIGSSLILIHLAPLLAIAISLKEIAHLIGDVSHQILHRPDFLSVTALAIALIPSTNIVVSSARAVMMQFAYFSPIGRRYSEFPGQAETLVRLRFSRGSRRTPPDRHLGAPGAPWSRPPSSSGREARAGVWMGAAFCAAGGLAIAVLAATGTTREGLTLALQSTGRLSFLFFWAAYAGSAVAAQFPRLDMLRRYRREFGLAFCSAQLVHLGLVVWHACLSHRPAAEAVMPFFAVGIVWTCLLALSSVARVQRLFSSELWRQFRGIGVEYIALVFLTDFVFSQVPGKDLLHQIAYLPFSILIMVAPVLRVAAIIRGL
jgi:hypothetical protein